VVLLAGALMTSVSWLPYVAVLGAAHPVFAVDAVGDAGRSVHDRPVRTRAELAAWFDELLNGLGIERAHVIRALQRRVYRNESSGIGGPAPSSV
jgi:pimeloyl-ACP methyl ester carboxylesterase